MAFLFRNKISYIYDKNGNKHLVFPKIFYNKKWNSKMSFIGQNIDCSSIADIAIADIAIVDFEREFIPSTVGKAVVGKTTIGKTKDI